MRALSLLLLCCLVFVPAFSQIAPDTVTNDIINTKVLRKGLYRTFQEFRSNSPSVTNIPVVIQTRDGSDRFWTGGSGYKLYIKGEGAEKDRALKGEFWGYCDGKDVFLRLRGQHVNVEKLETIGLYCYYTDHTIDPTGAVMFGAIGGAIAASQSNTGMPAIMNINNGTHGKLTNEMVEKMLERDEELRRQIGPVRKYKGDRLDFIVLYNQRNGTTLIKPLQP